MRVYPVRTEILVIACVNWVVGETPTTIISGRFGLHTVVSHDYYVTSVEMASLGGDNSLRVVIDWNQHFGPLGLRGGLFVCSESCGEGLAPTPVILPQLA